MVRRLVLTILLVISCVLVRAQSITTLNNYLRTYSSNIKVCNPLNPQYHSCIYETNYMTAELQGHFLILKFGFGYRSDWGYIDEDVLKIDLSTATLYTGYWSHYSGQWEHGGKKEILTIKDDNGMDIWITGRQNYNQGTKQNLLSEFYISFGTQPVASKVIQEIYNIQEKYKAKEPWQVKESQYQATPPSSNSNKTSSSKQSKFLKSWEKKMKR